MAKIAELDWDSWNAWVAHRPQEVQELCTRYPPDRLYRMKSTGQRVSIMSYSEDNTVRVFVSGVWNFVTIERQVFGVDPNDLEERELPTDADMVGVLAAQPDGKAHANT